MRGRYGTYIVTGVIFAALAVFYSVGSKQGFVVNLLIVLLADLVLAESWSLIYGYMGEFSFGHIVFFGVGQYTVALMNLHGILLDPILYMLVGGAAAAVAGALTAYPLLRIRGWYFSLGTFAFMEIIYTIILGEPSVTNASLGVFITGGFPSLGYAFMLIAVVGMGTVGLFHFIVNSNFGLALKSIRDNYDAARMIGINPVYYRVVTFVISAFLAGLAGGYMAQYYGYVGPDGAFDQGLNFTMLIMSFAGGATSALGPLIGSALVTILEEVGRSFILRGFLLVLAVALIPIMIVMPGGIMGAITRKVPLQNPFKKRK